MATETTWTIQANTRKQRAFTVLNDADEPQVITGWEVDAKIRDWPGGALLYTFPASDIDVDGPAGRVTLTVPAGVSQAWAWHTGWLRVVVTDPAGGTADNPARWRVHAERVVVAPD